MLRVKRLPTTAALLARADPELRHEVELLLSERKGGEFLDRPAIEHAFDLLEDSAAVAMAAGGWRPAL
jgi:hypothetical protein